MSRRQRARIERIGPGLTPRPASLPLPAGAADHGAIRRGDQDGRLLRLASGLYVMQAPDGALGALNQDKVAALLAAGTQGHDDD